MDSALRKVLAAVLFAGCAIYGASANAEDAVYYPNCAAARAAGAAPIKEGEPGYRAGLDRDHDGVACE